MSSAPEKARELYGVPEENCNFLICQELQFGNYSLDFREFNGMGGGSSKGKLVK